jgi:predicted nucleic acid-binding protein
MKAGSANPVPRSAIRGRKSATSERRFGSDLSINAIPKEGVRDVRSCQAQVSIAAGLAPDENDLGLAATALALGATLVSRERFRRN